MGQYGSTADTYKVSSIASALLLSLCKNFVQGLVAFPFLRKETVVQRGEVPCLRLYGWYPAEFTLDLPLPWLKVRS